MSIPVLSSYCSLIPCTEIRVYEFSVSLYVNPLCIFMLICVIILSIITETVSKMLIIFYCMDGYFPMSSFSVSFGGFYDSGLSDTLVEVSKHKHIVQTRIKVAFITRLNCQYNRATLFVTFFFVSMLNKGGCMSMIMSQVTIELMMII